MTWSAVTLWSDDRLRAEVRELRHLAALLASQMQTIRENATAGDAFAAARRELDALDTSPLIAFIVGAAFGRSMREEGD